MYKRPLQFSAILLFGLLLMAPNASTAPHIALPTEPGVPGLAPIAGPKAPVMSQIPTSSHAASWNSGTPGTGSGTGSGTDAGMDAGMKALTGLANKLAAALDNTQKDAQTTSAPAQDTASPGIGSADNNGGYGARVLEKLLPYWQPPAGASGVVTISLRIGSDGRPLYCEPVKRSGNPQLDELPCQAALRAGSFGNPPYGIVTEVFVTLATDRAAFGGGKVAEPQRSYAEEIMHRVKPHVQVPPGLGGASHTVELLLRITSAGGVEELSVSRSSGRQDVDNAVLAAIRTPGVLPPLPADSTPRELRLLFTVTGN